MSRRWETVGCAESLCVRLAKTSGVVLGLAILLWNVCEPLQATTVRPLSFDDAVRSAEAIFVGRVVAVRPRGRGRRWTGSRRIMCCRWRTPYCLPAAFNAASK